MSNLGRVQNCTFNKKARHGTQAVSTPYRPRYLGGRPTLADDEMRSANGQVEWILRDALKRAGRLPKKEPSSKDAPKGKEG